MPAFDLVSEDVLTNLPEDPSEAFLKILNVANEKYRLLSQEKEIDAAELRFEYVQVIKAVAEELGIDVKDPGNSHYPSNFSEFQSRLQAIRTQLIVRKRKEVDVSTIIINATLKEKMRNHIERLREHVNESYFDESKKERLYKILSELESELERDRIRIRKILTGVALVATILGGTTATLASAPKVAESLAEILGIVGEVANAEDEAPPRLAPPLKRLSAPKPTPEAEEK